MTADLRFVVTICAWAPPFRYLLAAPNYTHDVRLMAVERTECPSRCVMIQMKQKQTRPSFVVVL